MPKATPEMKKGSQSRDLPFLILKWLLTKDGGCGKFKHILKAFPSIISVEDLVEQIVDYPNLTWLLDPIAPAESIVRAYYPIAQICSQHYKAEDCEDTECASLHVCFSKLYYNHCSCVSTDNCLASDAKIYSVDYLRDFQESELQILLRNSFLAVCLGYNTVDGCANMAQYNTCPYVHVCVEKVRGNCSAKADCPWNHSLLKDPHHRMLYDCRQLEVDEDTENSLMAKLLIPPMTGLLLQCLVLKGKQGADGEDLELYLGINRKEVGLFVQAVQRQAIIYGKRVFIKMSAFQICPDYNAGTKCSCYRELFHVCAVYIMDNCSQEKCALNHDLHDDRNELKFSRMKCSHLSTEMRRSILRTSALVTCPKYKETGLCSEKGCVNMHVCDKWLSNSCTSGKCQKEHSFKTLHNREVIKVHDMNPWKEHELKKKIDVHRLRDTSLKDEAQQETSLPTIDDQITVKEPLTTALTSVQSPEDIVTTGVHTSLEHEELPTIQQTAETKDVSKEVSAINDLSDPPVPDQFSLKDIPLAACAEVAFSTGLPGPTAVKKVIPRTTTIESRSHLSTEMGRSILRISPLVICPKYKETGLCSEKGCVKMHVCDKWLSNSCTSGKCQKEHSFKTLHNREVIKVHDMNPWKEHELKKKIAITPVHPARTKNEQQSLQAEEQQLTPLLTIGDEITAKKTSPTAQPSEHLSDDFGTTKLSKEQNKIEFEELTKIEQNTKTGDASKEVSTINDSGDHPVSHQSSLKDIPLGSSTEVALNITPTGQIAIRKEIPRTKPINLKDIQLPDNKIVQPVNEPKRKGAHGVDNSTTDISSNITKHEPDDAEETLDEQVEEEPLVDSQPMEKIIFGDEEAAPGEHVPIKLDDTKPKLIVNKTKTTESIVDVVPEVEGDKPSCVQNDNTTDDENQMHCSDSNTVAIYPDCAITESNTVSLHPGDIAKHPSAISLDIEDDTIISGCELSQESPVDQKVPQADDGEKTKLPSCEDNQVANQPDGLTVQLSLPPARNYIWKWLAEGGIWQPYGIQEDGIQQDLIEARYQEYLQSGSAGIILFETHAYMYEINLSNMHQKNFTTNKYRPVLRKESADGSDFKDIRVTSFAKQDLPVVIPPWSPMDTRNPLQAEMVALAFCQTEFLEVTNHFCSTFGSSASVSIVQVYRLQNIHLWSRYNKMREEMCDKLGDDLNERNLFHGTPDFDTVRCICNQNFDSRISGRHGTKWGNGAYFASASAFSHHYTSPSFPSGRRYIFLATVLVGRCAQGARGLKRPPPYGVKRHGVLYDSTADNPKDPRTFVIFNNDQAYPMYLIEYIDISTPIAPPSAANWLAPPYSFGFVNNPQNPGFMPPRT